MILMHYHQPKEKKFGIDWHIGENMEDENGFLLIDYCLRFHFVYLNVEDI